MIVQRQFSLAKLHMSRSMVAVFCPVKYGNIHSLLAQPPNPERIRLKDEYLVKGNGNTKSVDFCSFKDWSSSMMTYLEELRQGTWGESTYKRGGRNN